MVYMYSTLLERIVPHGKTELSNVHLGILSFVPLPSLHSQMHRACDGTIAQFRSIEKRSAVTQRQRQVSPPIPFIVVPSPPIASRKTNVRALRVTLVLQTEYTTKTSQNVDSRYADQSVAHHP